MSLFAPSLFFVCFSGLVIPSSSPLRVLKVLNSLTRLESSTSEPVYFLGLPGFYSGLIEGFEVFLIILLSSRGVIDSATFNSTTGALVCIKGSVSS